MPTIKSRVNIVFETDSMTALSRLARKQHRSVSAMARELVLEAMALHEDQALSQLAEKRESQTKKWIPSSVAWKS